MAAVKHIETCATTKSYSDARRLEQARRWYRAVICVLPGLAGVPAVSWVLDCFEGAFQSVRAALQLADTLARRLEPLLRDLPRRLRELATIAPEPEEEIEPVIDLTAIAHCAQPLLFDIMSFACGSPCEVKRLTEQTSRLVTEQLEPVRNTLWSNLYNRRWPAFFQFWSSQGPQDWCQLYQETLAGKTECILEIFDREKKLGFAMAVMPARVTYEATLAAYVARYISAGEVHPETIPKWEEHRLRCCPLSVRHNLEPGPLPEIDTVGKLLTVRGDPSRSVDDYYPYRVLEGTDGLRVGQGIELQWKMQYGSPFGWWYAHLDALEHDKDGVLATATITFRHFPSNSRWYMQRVRFGDSELRPSSFGGFTGGIRSATEAEQKHWMNFFPRKAVIQ